MNEQNDRTGSLQVIEYLKHLDSRISKIEAALNFNTTNYEVEEKSDVSEIEKFNKPDELELNMGEYWFANFGIVLLAIGAAFFMTLPFDNLHPAIPSSLGYVFVGVVFLFAHIWRKSLEYISHYLVGTGLTLLYFSTLRLFHFSDNPLITNIFTEAILLTIIMVVSLGVSRKRNSYYLTLLSLIFGCATALTINDLYFFITSLGVISGLFVYYYYKNNWDPFYILGIAVCYLTYFIWAVNNPFHGNEIMLVNSGAIGLLLLLLMAALFSAGNLIRKGKLDADMMMVNTIVNALGCFVLFHTVNLFKYSENSFLLQIAFFTVFATTSSIYKMTKEGQHLDAVFAVPTFLSLSFTILFETSIPMVFILLIWQSLLMVFVAIWFKSKGFIVTNFFIFLLIFLSYLVISGNFNLISLSFGAVAIISARVLNWQKHRLTIQTELMRNTYLAVAFFSIPFTLYNSLESDYIAFSWLLVSIIYYGLSLMLKNYKYRWMAHLTLLGTAIYSFIYGFSSAGNDLKILTFFALGIVLIGVSIIYFKLDKKMKIHEMKTS